MKKFNSPIVLGKGAIGRICEELGYKTIDSRLVFDTESGFHFAIGFGSLYMNERKDEFIRLCRGNIPINVIDENVWISKKASVGLGNIILRNTIIANGAKVSSNNFIGYGVDVDHDVKIGCHNFIGPGTILCGEVEIGDECMIGAGVRILPQIKIADKVTIGAGSVVTKDVKFGKTIKGVPAR